MSDRHLVIIHGWSDDYRSFKKIGNILKDKGIAGSITLSKKELVKIFQPNRTALVSIKIKRYQSEKVFEFKGMRE